MSPREIAQRAVFGFQIVYVGNEPLVLAHARASGRRRAQRDLRQERR